MTMPNASIDNQRNPADSDLQGQVAVLQNKLLEEQNLRQALESSEKRYRRLFESARDGILILDAETGKVVDVNPFLLQLLGYSYHALCGQYIWELGVFKDIAASKEAFKTLQDSEYIRYEDLPLETHDGHPIAVEFVSNVYLVDQSKVIQCNIRDITARKRDDAERKRLLAAIEQAGEGIVMTDAQGNIEFVNPAFEQMTGYSHTDLLGRNPRLLKSDAHDELFYSDLWETISSGRTWAGRMVNKRKDGSLYTEETTISPVREASGRIVNYVAVKRDITEQLRLAAQFQQSQKMEAVGLLAGGVAHDYNNMLSVILGYAELALEKVDPVDPLHDDLKIIITAAKRSAGITRQLLTFARKQTIVPVVLDLNQTVETMLAMIRRLIGEDIDLAWLPKANLRPIKMDPTQIDQILVNLCVNARDALVGAGKITIETGNIVFDTAYCADHFGFVEGAYVLLTVSDDGCGMSKEVMGHLFDPFFTTKAEGHGTGLGLSTVHGIVKQNEGFINVYSELGNGTTFRIYLPQHVEQAVVSVQTKPLDMPLSQGETVLVVEDEPVLLMMAQMMLRKLGYQVLAAGTPSEAIELAKKHESQIHLAITDVVMPEMNGRDLAECLRPLCPSLKILFMSGYPADVIARRGVLEAGVNFLQKPFSVHDLATKVREVLQEQDADLCVGGK
ncbi:PAS domain-containing sensor histidine kinase [Desulfobulbus sp.]|uniref:hybrid sensor histidine kinase/response regulator n=1 Tax=Desulfobulbus sp. TaxID=895 RepID=UPI0027B99F1E|nr:PAS domain-containing sensor histidine kinase [Desulfobulbus sp.]